MRQAALAVDGAPFSTDPVKDYCKLSMRKTMNEKEIITGLLEPASTGRLDDVRLFAGRLADRYREQGDVEFSAWIDGLFNLGEIPPGLLPLKTSGGIDKLNLPPNVRAIVDEFLEEIRERDVLMAADMEPRHKMLLQGPPGNGKTVLAKALAVELGVPAFMVRYDDLIETSSQRAGQSSRNLLKMFSWAMQQPCLLFFDEFDALGRERDDNQESGEMKRVVSNLLVQLDTVPSHVVIIAATNHAKMLDSAIWRRFNIRLELPKPDLEQFPIFIREKFEQMGFPDIRYGKDRASGEINLETINLRLDVENFSDAELFAKNCKRHFVLSKGTKTIERAILDELERWTAGQSRQNT